MYIHDACLELSLLSQCQLFQKQDIDGHLFVMPYMQLVRASTTRKNITHILFDTLNFL